MCVKWERGNEIEVGESDKMMEQKGGCNERKQREEIKREMEGRVD